MKHALIKSLLISASVAFTAITQAASPLPMPEFNETPEAMTLEELQLEVPRLNRAVGANPPTFYNVNHKNKVYDEWTKYLGATLILKPASKQEYIERVHIITNLFFQGYNMNITGAGAKAHEAIQLCLKVAPESTECKLLSAMFYMSADATKMEEVKQSLDRLSQEFGENKNVDLEITKAYYYIYANEHDQALTQIELLETSFKDLKKDNIKKYRLTQLQEFKVAILNEKKKQQKEMDKLEQQKTIK